MSILTDIRYALRSLARVKGLAVTVILTLALGIGANAAIFSVVRGVLLRPLVNDDEERLIYIRQTAKGRGSENANFSVPEIRDLRARVTTIGAFGDFSTLDFTLVGLGEPRVVKAGVVGGSYFSVMGLRPVRGRLLDATDDGPQAAPAAVLTHRFWSTDAQQRRIGRRQDHQARRPRGDDRRRARAVDSVSRGNRDHRQRRDELASHGRHDAGWPRAPHDRAVRPVGAGRDARAGARRAADGAWRHPRRASGSVSGERRLPHRSGAAARPDHVAGANGAARAAGGIGA